MSFAIQMETITKVYPNGVVANKNASFSVKKGEIHALVGENGAGKTTLMKILFGIEEATEGTIKIFGDEVAIHSVNDALRLGLGMVQQHFMLVPGMTVIENILLNEEPVKGIFLDQEKAARLTQELCEKYQFDIDINADVDDLAVGDRQKVEILKVLYREAKVIILDEPTAVLTPQETEELFRQLIVLRNQGHTIIFISHKLREIKQFCDRVTVMRKGMTVGTYNVGDVSMEEISAYMMGTSVELAIDKRPIKVGQTFLRIRDLHYANEHQKQILKGINFDLRSGEVLGLVGVEGNGQRELVEIITGIISRYSGLVEVGGQDIATLSVGEIRSLSSAHIPQERMTKGISKEASITENLSALLYKERVYCRGPFIKWKSLNGFAREKIEEYRIVTESENTLISNLSGGNIQKVVVAREFTGSPQLIVADQPTRGIDVGAANLIHNKILQLRDQGSAVLLITRELDEALSLADTIIVLYDGLISACFNQVNGLLESDLGFYMLGVRRQSDEEIMRCVHDSL